MRVGQTSSCQPLNPQIINNCYHGCQLTPVLTYLVSCLQLKAHKTKPLFLFLLQNPVQSSQPLSLFPPRYLVPAIEPLSLFLKTLGSAVSDKFWSLPEPLRPSNLSSQIMYHLSYNKKFKIFKTGLGLAIKLYRQTYVSKMSLQGSN